MFPVIVTPWYRPAWSRKTLSLKRRRSKAQTEKDVDSNEGNDEDDDDSDVASVQQTTNTARRILWQRRHAAIVPSTVRGLVQEATVTRLEDALQPLQTLGYAILDDMTEAFAPRNRCTKKKRNFIHKCKTPPH